MGLGAPVELFCCQFLLVFRFSSLFFIFQLETGVGAGGLLLNRQFPLLLTIEHSPDITKEKNKIHLILVFNNETEGRKNITINPVTVIVFQLKDTFENITFFLCHLKANC